MNSFPLCPWSILIHNTQHRKLGKARYKHVWQLQLLFGVFDLLDLRSGLTHESCIFMNVQPPHSHNHNLTPASGILWKIFDMNLSNSTSETQLNCSPTAIPNLCWHLKIVWYETHCFRYCSPTVVALLKCIHLASSDSKLWPSMTVQHFELTTNSSLVIVPIFAEMLVEYAS